LEKGDENLSIMKEKTIIWTGRIDGDGEEHLRWHQAMLYEINPETQMVILGFACDEGVRRNKGRIGAKSGPDALRNACSNFPVHKKLNVADLGDIICENQNLEKAQEELATQVAEIQNQNLHSIVFGGGHEVMYGHFSGLRKAFPSQKIGIINFDAHFDNRPIIPKTGPTSGTGFWQIAQTDQNYAYLAIGIQENSNTRALFDFADQSGTQYLLGKDFHLKNEERILAVIHQFIAEIDVLYVTVCMDVFSAAFAPGVSATAYNGLIPDTFFQDIFRKIISDQKLKAFDIAELNPVFDFDHSTAKFGASLVFEVINAKK